MLPVVERNLIIAESLGYPQRKIDNKFIITKSYLDEFSGFSLIGIERQRPNKDLSAGLAKSPIHHLFDCTFVAFLSPSPLFYILLFHLHILLIPSRLA